LRITFDRAARYAVTSCEHFFFLVETHGTLSAVSSVGIVTLVTYG